MIYVVHFNLFFVHHLIISHFDAHRFTVLLHAVFYYTLIHFIITHYIFCTFDKFFSSITSVYSKIWAELCMNWFVFNGFMIHSCLYILFTCILYSIVMYQDVSFIAFPYAFIVSLNCCFFSSFRAQQRGRPNNSHRGNYYNFSLDDYFII